MFDSDSVGGADDSRNGFWNRTPVKVVERSAISSSRAIAGRVFMIAGAAPR
jgi:hypothetical protein